MDESANQQNGGLKAIPESATADPAIASTRDRLVRLAYRFLWNRDDAEDVAHEALVKAYERQDELRDRSKWWSWICRIVVHRCHEKGRRRQRKARHEPLIQAEALRRATTTRSDASTSDKEAVRRLVAELPRRQREVIVLRHLQGMSFEEIGGVLEISPSTARVHARQGRETLRRWMVERDEV